MPPSSTLETVLPPPAAPKPKRAKKPKEEPHVPDPEPCHDYVHVNDGGGTLYHHVCGVIVTGVMRMHVGLHTCAACPFTWGHPDEGPISEEDEE